MDQDPEDRREPGTWATQHHHLARIVEFCLLAGVRVAKRYHPRPVCPGAHRSSQEESARGFTVLIAAPPLRHPQAAHSMPTCMGGHGPLFHLSCRPVRARRGVHLGNLPEASGSKIDETLRKGGGRSHTSLAVMYNILLFLLFLSLLCLFLSLFLSGRCRQSQLQHWRKLASLVGRHGYAVC
jgi:hypothetical protein